MRLLHWILCASFLAAASSARAEDVATVKKRLPAPQAKIVNGVFEANYPTVGALLHGNNPDSADAWCSGTLIGCQTFLTAGHCVEGMTASDFTVFLPSGGFFSVTSIALHPSFSFPETDVAVIKLGAPVNGIAPTPINATIDPAPNTPGLIVGYGRSGGSNFDYGLKRSGAVVTSACPGDPFFSGSVCWYFDTPLGPPGSNSDTCNADSGGPLLIDFGAGNVVAGITSGGTSANCDPGELSYDLNVFQQKSFIEGAGGADLSNTSCGSLPQVGTPSAAVQSATGTLGGSQTQAVHGFNIPPGTTELRVAMSGSEDFGSDFDLYVKQGSAPTTSIYDCRDYGSNQYGYCQFDSPASGTWYVLANRFSGSGPYQITVTSFGDPCAEPGSDGQPCDDGNPCSGPDLCQSGACVGPEPATSCRHPVIGKASILQFKDKLPPNAGDRLLFKWARGQQTTKQEFGDPMAATDYWLCIYDRTAGVPTRIVTQKIPAGSRWSKMGNGHIYRDRKTTLGGISAVRLKQGGDGKAKIVVRGKGDKLQMPPLGLAQDPTVTAQLLNGSLCWEANYSTHKRNDAAQFKARADDE